MEKLLFEQSQLLQGSDEDGPGGERETNERVRELERQAVETHNEMGQVRGRDKGREGEELDGRRMFPP